MFMSHFSGRERMFGDLFKLATLMARSMRSVGPFRLMRSGSSSLGSSLSARNVHSRMAALAWWLFGQVPPNKSFKPTPLRGAA